MWTSGAAILVLSSSPSISRMAKKSMSILVRVDIFQATVVSPIIGDPFYEAEIILKYITIHTDETDSLIHQTSWYAHRILHFVLFCFQIFLILQVDVRSLHTLLLFTMIVHKASDVYLALQKCESRLHAHIPCALYPKSSTHHVEQAIRHHTGSCVQVLSKLGQFSYEKLYLL